MDTQLIMPVCALAGNNRPSMRRLIPAYSMTREDSAAWTRN
ncbi:hypothetical protein [Nocardia sp. NPDC052566]